MTLNLNGHRRVIRGLFALAGLSVDAATSRPLSQSLGQQDQIDP